MQRKQQGFTLIELMIVIAIIAILMSFAIPAYRDYTVRTKVGEGIQLAAAAKQAVTETYMSTNTYPTTNAEAGLNSVIAGEYTSAVTVGANGVITVTYKSNAGISGGSITLTPTDSTGSVEWNCASTIAAKYVPSECRT
jgi:type IV pilus assembly protein PilA